MQFIRNFFRKFFYIELEKIKLKPVYMPKKIYLEKLERNDTNLKDLLKNRLGTMLIDSEEGKYMNVVNNDSFYLKIVDIKPFKGYIGENTEVIFEEPFIDDGNLDINEMAYTSVVNSDLEGKEELSDLHEFVKLIYKEKLKEGSINIKYDESENIWIKGDYYFIEENNEDDNK